MFWKEITRRGHTFPSSAYGIPVILWVTPQDNLMGLAWIKWYVPWAKKDRIIIFERTLERGDDYVKKVILHEAAHFIYHRSIKEETKDFWGSLATYIPSFITRYAWTSPAEDFAELHAHSYYFDNNLPLPDNTTWDEKVEFKYWIVKKLMKHWLIEFNK